MNTEVIVSLVTLLGSALGTFCGITVNTKLTNYRIEQLEKKVEKHNNVVERTRVIEEQIKVINHRIEDIEKEKRRDAQ